jgi:putative aldouronate transport system permease protein
MRHRLTWFDWANGIVLSLVMFACAYPFVYMIAISLSDSGAITQGEIWLWPKQFNIDMYRYIFEDGRVVTGYKNSIIYVVLGTAISLAVTTLGAYSLAKKNMVLNKTFMLLIVFTMFFNGGMIPTFLVVKSLGLVDTIWAMVLPGAVTTWNLLIMRTFFLELPYELEESGKMDGLTDVGIVLRIVLPLSKPVLATMGLFYAVHIWNGFLGPLLYLRDHDLYPLPLFLRDIVLAGEASGSEGPIGSTMAMNESALKYTAIIVSTLPILLIYPFIQKYFVKGALIGSVKG